MIIEVFQFWVYKEPHVLKMWMLLWEHVHSTCWYVWTTCTYHIIKKSNPYTNLNVSEKINTYTSTSLRLMYFCIYNNIEIEITKKSHCLKETAKRERCENAKNASYTNNEHTCELISCSGIQSQFKQSLSGASSTSRMWNLCRREWTRNPDDIVVFAVCRSTLTRMT